MPVRPTRPVVRPGLNLIHERYFRGPTCRRFLGARARPIRPPIGTAFTSVFPPALIRSFIQALIPFEIDVFGVRNVDVFVARGNRLEACRPLRHITLLFSDPESQSKFPTVLGVGNVNNSLARTEFIALSSRHQVSPAFIEPLSHSKPIFPSAGRPALSQRAPNLSRTGTAAMSARPPASL